MFGGKEWTCLRSYRCEVVSEELRVSLERRGVLRVVCLVVKSGLVSEVIAVKL